ncbi:MAG TPA: biotin--[acetyl-CoA-carboxylase] ligase [Polyangia bacterium]|nr:biotin--[acetyl-CoA-carboxylase] ligase [Polyangia bacterium]
MSPRPDETIVARLRACAGAWVSGQTLAHELGLSRAAVAKRVAALRLRGFQIDAQARRGYRLLGLPDSLETAVLVPLLHTRWAGRPLEWVESCSSTSDVAAERARAGAPHGLCVVAEAQERGRGRAGRVWFSPPRANLYLSLLVRPPLPPVRVPPLALAVGVAAAEALHEQGLAVDLKWPNDLLVRGRKLGGILIEMASELERVSFAVIGIGVNVNVQAPALPEELRDRATSMAIETGHAHVRAQVAACLLERVEAWYERFVAEGPGPAARAFRAAAQATLGRRVRVLSDRDAPIEGVAEDISDEGALLLRDESGRVQTIVAGEVVL